MNFLVTGGAGFIGSNLIDQLLEDGHNVTNIDNFDSFYSKSIKQDNIKNHIISNRYKLIEADIRDYDHLESVIGQDFDVIVHLAAKAGVRPSIENPIECQEVNVTGTQNLLEIARMKGIKQFVFASSSSVYGKNPNVPWKEMELLLQPISPYASTKISGELLGHVYSHLYDIRFLALRFFTVYGPRQRPDLAIHKFLKIMSEGKNISIYGKGDTRRDYTYIDDIVKGIISASTYKKSDFEIFNLGNNDTIELKDLVEKIESASGLDSSKVYVEEQPGDVKQTWANIEFAKEELGYAPNYNIDLGLSKFVEWFNSLKK